MIFISYYVFIDDPLRRFSPVLFGNDRIAIMLLDMDFQTVFFCMMFYTIDTDFYSYCEFYENMKFYKIGMVCIFIEQIILIFFSIDWNANSVHI